MHVNINFFFKRGYQELIKNNFFETKGKDINSYNLIDRINLHFKHHENVEFSDDEMVWVKKADATKTCAEVLDLAEELHTFMKEQQESQESMTDNHDMSGEGDSGEGESGEGMEGFGEDSGEQEMKEILQDPFTSETETEEFRIRMKIVHGFSGRFYCLKVGWRIFS